MRILYPNNSNKPKAGKVAHLEGPVFSDQYQGGKVLFIPFGENILFRNINLSYIKCPSSSTVSLGLGLGRHFWRSMDSGQIDFVSLAMGR